MKMTLLSPLFKLPNTFEKYGYSIQKFFQKACSTIRALGRIRSIRRLTTIIKWITLMEPKGLDVLSCGFWSCNQKVINQKKLFIY